MTNVVELSVGDEHALALTQEGRLYSWYLPTSAFPFPLLTHSPSPHTRFPSRVDSSSFPLCCIELTIRRGVASLGRTGHGVLPQDQLSIPEPTEIPFFKSLREQPNPVQPQLISAGQCHNLVVTSDGILSPPSLTHSLDNAYFTL